MNNIVIVGNVGQKPERRTFTRDGEEQAIASFTVAVNPPRGRGGADRDPDWFTVKVFGNQAEPVLEYLDKGHKVAVSGSMRSSKVEREGGTVTYWEVNANRVEFLTPKGEGGTPPSQPQAAAQPKAGLPF